MSYIQIQYQLELWLIYLLATTVRPIRSWTGLKKSTSLSHSNLAKNNVLLNVYITLIHLLALIYCCWPNCKQRSSCLAFWLMNTATACLSGCKTRQAVYSKVNDTTVCKGLHQTVLYGIRSTVENQNSSSLNWISTYRSLCSVYCTAPSVKYCTDYAGTLDRLRRVLLYRDTPSALVCMAGMDYE